MKRLSFRAEMPHPCPLGFDVWWCRKCGERSWIPEFRMAEGAPSMKCGCGGDIPPLRIGHAFELGVTVFHLNVVDCEEPIRRRVVNDDCYW